MTRKNGKNEGASDYWQGYREAYEDVLFFGLEHIKQEGVSNHRSGKYMDGYLSRLNKLSMELVERIKHGE